MSQPRGWVVRARGGLAGRVGLAIAFLLVHVVLWLCNVVRISSTPADDTGSYLQWMELWRSTGKLVGINTPWVYPVGALPPMQLAFAFGPGRYLTAWIVMVSLLNAAAMVLLARRSMRAAWWWLGCIALLGPLGLSHLDGFALPFVIVGVLAVSRRPAVAAVLFTIGAWIKVWPAAMVAALLVAGRRRLAVLAAAASTTAVVLAVAVAAGARTTLFSFIGAQAGRGLQIEAPIASFWLIWGALGGPPRIVYDRRILTFEVNGRWAHGAAVVMTPVLALGVAAVVVLALIAVRRSGDRELVLACTALGLVSALIALNKVGSPQYYDWIVAPVLLGLLSTRRLRAPAWLVLIISALTFVIYPLGYNGILHLQPAMIAVLAVRNALVVVLFAWSVWQLALLARAPRAAAPRPVSSARPAPVGSAY